MISKLWVMQLVLTPCGPLTFRRMPAGLLHIMTYPFVPPTTLNGFLARLWYLADGQEWPNYGDVWYGDGPGKKFTLTLPQGLRALGAFPPTYTIHTGHRQGPKEFGHTKFSQLYHIAQKKEPAYQLHVWDYLFAESFTGWVVARSEQALAPLGRLRNYGGKIGKEGFAYVSDISKPRELPLRRGPYRPLGLVPGASGPTSGTYYPLYAHVWSRDYLWPDGTTGGVVGFKPLGMWWHTGTLDGAYWEYEPGCGFPATVPDVVIQGMSEQDREAFFQETKEQ